MKKAILTIICGLLCLYTLKAQELNCNVQINSDQIQGTNKQVYNTLQRTINEYMNNRKWTNMTFSASERIECGMTIIISQAEDNFYTAELQIQARRPVYNSSYDTPLLNFRDESFCFTYSEYDRIEYQENVFTTNLAAMLTYYGYLIIGYDMDSFSRYGGTPYFQICENIVNAAQSASLTGCESDGWKAFNNHKNRYALINNLMDEAFKKYRSYLYEYHRLGLDEMYTNVANGRAKMAANISVLKECYNARLSGIAITAFLDAKADELVNVFAKGTAQEKTDVYNVLISIDPTRANLYEKIAQ